MGILLVDLHWNTYQQCGTGRRSDAVYLLLADDNGEMFTGGARRADFLHMPLRLVLPDGTYAETTRSVITLQ